MCDNLLKHILTGSLELRDVIKWLQNEETTDDFNRKLKLYNCLRTEFILYVLKYIHEETASVFRTIPDHVTPVKIKTPRCIDNITTKNKYTPKRTNLFPKEYNSENNSYLDSSTECITSTPKLNKSGSRCDYNRSESDQSLSPIYNNKRRSFQGIKQTRHNTTLCLGDFFTDQKSTYKKKMNTSFDQSVTNRRINPTNLNTVERRTIPKGFSFQDVKDAESVIPKGFSFQDVKEIDRNKLREEMNQIRSRSKLTETDFVRVRVHSLTGIEPDLEKVTLKPQLDILAQIYSTLITCNFILNPFSELYFFVSLILVTFTPTEFDLSYFSTVHNCVYFAVRVLTGCFGPVLAAFDRSTLKLLAENSRLKSIAPGFVTELLRAYNCKVERRMDLVRWRNETGGNVSFISDTDNRDNFSSDTSFHAFRKQRDLFYEILRTWDINHMQRGWHFATHLAAKIRTLLTMHSDPVNAMHLARLIKKQLLADESAHWSCADDCAQIPLGLAHVDASKLSMLRDRLVSKGSTGGPSPESTFPGRQEFYVEFVVTAGSLVFTRHFADCLSAEVGTLNQTEFWTADEEKSDVIIDTVTKSLYICCLRSLRVLAKFLGFLDSLPYKSDECPTHTVLESQVAVRKNFVPSIDVLNHLQNATQTGQLILTIPWIVEYLAVLDYTTLRLPYFQNLTKILFNLHFQLKIERPLLVKFCLGWLFERQNFPLDIYQSYMSNKYHSSDIRVTQMPVTMDQLDLIDESVLFLCCPYLVELRNILSSDPNSNFNNSGTVKFIRPVSAVPNDNQVVKNRLQVQLEEAFFHGQPSSVRRTVDLVSERITSVCVKYICNVFVPNSKAEALNTFKMHLEHVHLLSGDELLLQLNKCCLEYSKELALTCYNSLIANLTKEIEICCKKRCECSLTALLPEDVHPAAKNTCISIATKQSKDRTQQWCSAHINIDIFTKEFKSEMENVKHNEPENSKKLTYNLPSTGRNVEHDPMALSPVTLLIKLQELTCTALQHSEEINLETLVGVVDEAVESCERRCDMNSIAHRLVNKLFLDIELLLATNRPEFACDPKFFPKLLIFWTKFLPPVTKQHKRHDLFDRVLCPRNFCMFEQSKNPTVTWNACAQLISGLLAHQLLDEEQFERQAIAMFRQSWAPDTVRLFADCLQTVVDEYVKRTGTNDKFAFILSWIAGFCCNDDVED